MNMSLDYSNLVGNKAENYWIAGVLPDYHKFKVDKYVTHCQKMGHLKEHLETSGEFVKLTNTHLRKR